MRKFNLRKLLFNIIGLFLIYCMIHNAEKIFDNHNHYTQLVKQYERLTLIYENTPIIKDLDESTTEQIKELRSSIQWAQNPENELSIIPSIRELSWKIVGLFSLLLLSTWLEKKLYPSTSPSQERKLRSEL